MNTCRRTTVPLFVLLPTLALLLVSTFGTAAQAQDLPGVTTFIKTYANFITSGQVAVVPEDVQATSDGGYILLAASGVPRSLFLDYRRFAMANLSG